MSDNDQPAANTGETGEVTGTSGEAQVTDGAANAEQQAGGSPTPEPTPNADSDFDLDVTTGYKAMADRRRNQLRERDNQLQQLQSNLAQREAEIAKIRQAAPYWMKELRTKQQLEREVAELTAKSKKFESIIQKARDEGWEGADELERTSEIDEIRSQITKLTQVLENRQSQPNPDPYPQQQYQQPVYQQQPLQQQQPQQYQQPVSESQQRQQAFDYFRREFAKLSDEAGIRELKAREQNVLDRWWRAGGELSVEDAMQDDLEYLYEKRKSRVSRKAAQHDELPAAGDGSGNSRSTTLPSANLDRLSGEASSDKPRGLAEVARAHREGRLQRRR